VKNPVRELEVHTIAVEPSQAARPRIRAAVHLRFDSDRDSNISINVTSPDAKLATELFAELEEQIDRTIVTNWIVQYIKSLRLPAVAAFVSGLLTAFGLFLARKSERRGLSDRDSAELQRLVTQARTDADKIDALVQAKLRELRAAEPLPSMHFDWSWMLSLRGLFIALPVIILIVTLSYLIAACYPWAAFAWGDAEEHYNSLIARRRMLGVVVLASLFIGIMANLFVASVPPLR
jgi:hypothetical protein